MSQCLPVDRNGGAGVNLPVLSWPALIAILPELIRLLVS